VRNAVAAPICLNECLTFNRLFVRKHIVIVVVCLFLFVAVYLAEMSYISAATIVLSLRVSTVTTDVYKSVTTVTSTTSVGAWSRDRHTSQSAAATITIRVDGNFTERVASFNIRLKSLRLHLRRRSTPPGNTGNTTCRIPDTGHTTTKNALRVVSGANENYIDELRSDQDIITVAVPWLGSRHNWTSMSDFSNVPYQRYYEWTADNALCSWIETPRVIRMRYDTMYHRTCNRNINDTARKQSLQPIHLNVKPLDSNYYWPNNGDSYPEHFYTTTPHYVFHMHIHRDAVITELGDVITANTKLVLYACSNDMTQTLPRGVNLFQISCYDEVYVITQYWGNGVFHRMAEIVPRLAVCTEFLKAHPEIRILGPQVGGRLAELLEIISLNKSRLITGVARAKIVYQPRATGCGTANVQESQMLSQLYRDYIRRSFPPQARSRLILIRRSGRRRFTEQIKIEKMMERAARDHNLTYTLFIDNPVPSLNDTMVMFHSAVVIVAPHGAGLINMFFSQPGTYVVEGVCNLPHVNLCFQRLAHILGHHWHGVTARGGCEAVVDVSATSVDDAVRAYLRLWMLEQFM